MKSKYNKLSGAGGGGPKLRHVTALISCKTVFCTDCWLFILKRIGKKKDKFCGAFRSVNLKYIVAIVISSSARGKRKFIRKLD